MTYSIDRDSDVQILAMARLRKFFCTWSSIWLKSRMIEDFTFDVIQSWWRSLASSTDPILQYTLSDFLVSLYGAWFWTARADTLQILLSPLICLR
jgi:hypothetical protein